MGVEAVAGAATDIPRRRKVVLVGEAYELDAAGHDRGVEVVVALEASIELRVRYNDGSDDGGGRIFRSVSGQPECNHRADGDERDDIE